MIILLPYVNHVIFYVDNGCLQGFVIAAIWTFSQLLHLDMIMIVQTLTIMPIIWLISATVPMPGGLGVMKYLFFHFFPKQLIQPLEH